MLLTSSSYFAFLGLLFFVYWLAVRRRLAALTLIAFANLFFYARWDLRYLALVPAASLADYLIASSLDRTGLRQATRRLLVACSILLNAGLIVSLKHLPG